MPETEEKKALEILSRYFADVSAISKTYVVTKSEPSTSLLNEIEKLPHFVNYTVYNRGSGTSSRLNSQSKPHQTPYLMYTKDLTS